MNATLDTLIIRTARQEDVPALVAIYAADEVGGHGDTTDQRRWHYLAAFRDIESSPIETLYGRNWTARDRRARLQSGHPDHWHPAQRQTTGRIESGRPARHAKLVIGGMINLSRR
ncbi:MAG: hypothetical protein U5L46_16335 [Agrobacterium sp.]|nr:hypothetical protein [Agrobacterium sp.]